MRCFIAAFVAADSARRLRAAYQRWWRLQGARSGQERPVPLENYHVTIAFLGEVEESRTGELLAAVAELEGAPGCATVTALTGLPRPAVARVAVAELAAQETLTAWWRRLATRVAADRGFRPHVTLARLPRRCTLAPLLLPQPLTVELQVPGLYRSDRERGAVRYRRVTGSASA